MAAAHPFGSFVGCRFKRIGIARLQSGSRDYKKLLLNVRSHCVTQCFACCVSVPWSALRCVRLRLNVRLALELQTVRSVNISKLYHCLCTVSEVSHKQITKCKEQGLSGENNRRSATGQIPWLLRNTDVHYRLSNSTILVPINSLMTPVLLRMDYSSQTDFNIILQPTA